MVSFGDKAKIKKAGNLNQGHIYVITTVSIDTNSNSKTIWPHCGVPKT